MQRPQRRKQGRSAHAWLENFIARPPCELVRAGQSGRAAHMKVKDLKVFIVGNPPPSWGGRYFIFVKLTTDNWHQRHRRMLLRHLRPQGHDGDDRGHLRPLRRGHGPVPPREPVAQGLWLRLLACAPTSRSWACSPASRSRCGTSSARRVNKPVYELLGGTRAREAALLHLHLSRSMPRARTARSSGTPNSRPSARRIM